MAATIRALIAILLMIGFYVLALGFAAGIVWFISDDWQSGNYDPRAFLGGPVLLGLLLWSIVPRRDRFQPPGPRIDAADEPELFRELSSIAKSVGQEVPHEVYLTLSYVAGRNVLREEWDEVGAFRHGGKTRPETNHC